MEEVGAGRGAGVMCGEGHLTQQPHGSTEGNRPGRRGRVGPGESLMAIPLRAPSIMPSPLLYAPLQASASSRGVDVGLQTSIASSHDDEQVSHNRTVLHGVFPNHKFPVTKCMCIHVTDVAWLP